MRDTSLPAFPWALDGAHMGSLGVPYGNMDPIWAPWGYARWVNYNYNSVKTYGRSCEPKVRVSLW